MQHSDFRTGLEFSASAGLRWRCTDVGSRTIVAVRLADHDDDPNWYRGPPYIVEEVVFDEKAIERCHLTQDDAILSTMHEFRTSGHPGYPHDDVLRMMEARLADAEHRYPHEGVLRFDRRTPEGEILHPYHGRRDGERWIVLIYLPFKKVFIEMIEREFISLPVTDAADIKNRSKKTLAD